VQFLLVHGGWQGGWCWDGVKAALEERGHEVYAPTLPGCEEDDVDRSGITLDDITSPVIAELARRDLRDVVAVGHSGGGPTIQLLREADPARFARLVFVDAWVLKDGERIYDVLPAELSTGLQATAAASPDRTVPMSPELWCSGLMNDVPEDEAMRWYTRVRPSPEVLMSEPLRLPAFATSGVPTSYVFLDDDVTVPRETYEANAARLTNPKVTTSPGAHEAMLTRPRELAEAILRVC
jgi:pimeloyl-ACP methyl ester carboxylesterase